MLACHNWVEHEEKEGLCPHLEEKEKKSNREHRVWAQRENRDQSENSNYERNLVQAVHVSLLWSGMVAIEREAENRIGVVWETRCDKLFSICLFESLLLNIICKRKGYILTNVAFRLNPVKP